MQEPKYWDDATVMRHLGANTSLNVARQRFSSAAAWIEQKSAQGQLGPIEMRRAEFQAVYAIGKAMGVEFP